MAEVHVEGELGASIDEVWKLVSDFGGIIEALGLPVDVEGDGVGAVRTISMGGSDTVERLEALDADAKSLTYSMVRGPLPVENYLATMQFTALGDGRTKLDWTATFDAARGGNADDLVPIVRSIYEGGIGGLQARFGA